MLYSFQCVRPLLFAFGSKQTINTQNPGTVMYVKNYTQL